MATEQSDATSDLVAVTPPMPKRAKTDDRELIWRNTISDELFTRWLFGGPSRIAMLKEFLFAPRNGCFNIVLTNGFAQHAQLALNCVGLDSAFRAIVDTRGVALVGEDLLEINGQVRYDKSVFVRDFVFDKGTAASSGLSELGIDHVIYVDDSVESAFVNSDLGGPVDVVQLPKEGEGLTSALLSQVARLCKTAGSKTKSSVCVVYDFDCTLSHKHMFKSICQPKSHWAKQWHTHCSMNKSVPNNPASSPSKRERPERKKAHAHSIATTPPNYEALDLYEKPSDNTTYTQ